MSSRRTVHIPIVQPGGSAGGRAEDRLIEVYTQHYAFDPLTKEEETASRAVDAKARAKDWDRVAAPLRKVGLYQAGCAAASAVRKLGIRQPLTALFQRISRLAWIEGQRLQSAGAQGPSEGRSAELGLALALLMCASGSRDRQIIATGALGGQPRGVSDADVAVEPVGSLPEKLRLVLTLAEHGGLPGLGSGRALTFFTPRQYEHQGAMAEVAELKEVAKLAAAGVRVIPVERLSEAARELRAVRSRHLFHDRVVQVVLVGLVLALGLGYGWWALREQAVPMTFLPGDTGFDPEPYQACFTSDGGFYPLPLDHDGLAPNIAIGETLVWRVRVGEPTDEVTGLRAWLIPEHYYVAQVMVSERSRAKVIVPQQTGAGVVKVAPGGIWEWGWQLNDRVESNGLVLLAKADEPFDPERLQAALVERYPESASDDGGLLDVTAAVNFVAGHAPGAAKFIVQTVERTDRCTP